MLSQRKHKRDKTGEIQSSPSRDQMRGVAEYVLLGI